MDIFTLTDESGGLLHPVRQAATFAKYSRSPESAHELVKKTDEVAGSKFQQKWIVKFGHNSIAELATLPVAFEGVSIVASKAIEAWQRPGVCEKSTRMQKFSRDSLVLPDGIDPNLLDRAVPLIDKAFSLYETTLKELPDVMARLHPEASEFQVSRMVFDIARYLLPAGCKTSLGICAYPRDIAEMISVLGGSPISEFRDIASGLKSATEELGGPLIRHTKPDGWANFVPSALVSPPRIPREANEVVLNRVGISETELLVHLRNRYGLGPKELTSLMDSRPEHHKVPDFFRKVTFDYSVYMDYGGFRDLQRHRRMNQYVEPLTPYHGFALPPRLDKISTFLYMDYRSLLWEFQSLEWPGDSHKRLMCQYLLPLAFLVGWHIELDLQQLYYLVELRTQEAGHPSYRQVSYDMLDLASEHYPFITQWVRPRADPKVFS